MTVPVSALQPTSITSLQALMLSADPEGDLRAAYAARIERARAAPRLPRSAGPLRVLLVGYSGACNTGADLRTGEIIRHLRGHLGADNIRFGVMVIGDHALPDWGDVTTERIIGFPPDAVHDLVAAHDAVLVAEGSVFTSTFADGMATMFTAFLAMAVAMGKPAVACGAEADEMSPAVERFVAEQAPGALLITRNHASFTRLAALGIAVEEGTDTGWSFDDADFAAADALLRAGGWDGAGPVIVICPTDPFRWPLVADPARALFASLSGESPPDRHGGMMFFQPAAAVAGARAAFLADIAQAMRDHAAASAPGAHIVIIGMEANDAAICADLAGLIGARDPIVAGTVDPSVIVGVLRRASLLVSARFHAVLLSMAAGVPALGLAYDQRLPALLDEAGYPALALDIRGEDLAGRLADAIRDVAATPGIGAAFARHAAAMRAVQADMMARVVDHLTNNAS